MDAFEKFFKLISPIKSVFGLYLLMYILPLSIPIILVMSIYEALMFKNTVNIPVAIIIGICALVSFAWTIFFLIYFTNQRNTNPDLYEKGFLSELTITGGQHE